MLKTIVSLMIVVSLCTSKVGRWGVEEEDGIGIITDENFASFLGKNSHVLVVFYHPEFASSKLFLEIYPKIAAKLKGTVGDIPLGKLNVLEETKTAKILAITKVPVIRLFTANNPIDYTLDLRDEDLLANWIIKKSGHPSIELKTTQELKQAEKVKIACHLFLDSKEQQDSLDNFNKLSMEYLNIPFYYTFSQDVKKNYQIEHKVTFIVWRDFDDFHKMLGDHKKIDYEEMKHFLDMVKNPLVRDLTRELAQSIWSNKQSTLFVFSDDSKSKGIEILRKLAPDFDDLKLVYVVSPITSDFGKEMSRFFGITEKDQDCARIIKFENMQIIKYKLDKITESSLKTFTDDFKNNKLNPYYKSDSAPQTNNGPVRIVVGNSFENEVLNTDKNVLLWTWAAFSDKCRILGPVYEQLATQLKNEPNLVFAKMNGVTNEHPSFFLDGFPTIQLFRKGDKEHPISFSEEPTFDNLVEFLSLNLNIKVADAKKGVFDEGL